MIRLLVCSRQPRPAPDQTGKFTLGIDLKPFIHAILEVYAFSVYGVHGVLHWARVLENGRALPEETGANVDVVSPSPSFTTHGGSTSGQIPNMDSGARAAEF